MNRGSVPTLVNNQLSWNGALEPDGQSVVIEYTVRLDEDVEPGTIVQNRASSQAVPPGGPPIVPPEVITQHPIPGFDLGKSSVPASGATVRTGETITYSVTGTNTGATILNPVVITDDLSQVTNNATLVGTPTSNVGPAPVVTGQSLTWTGTLNPGQVVTLTYTVQVNDTVGEATLIRNVVTGFATPPGPPDEPIRPPEVSTEHPVPGYTLAKTSDPSPGSPVRGGQRITYTVTGTNTGATVLDPVVITDDLSLILNHAALVDDPAASLGDTPTLDGTDLRWEGALDVGESVVVTYTVLLNEDVPEGVTLENTVNSAATPPGPPDEPEPITPPEVSTEHPVPGFQLTKVSDPEPGTTVLGGETIVYTVTGSNTGATVLDPVVITDDLSRVLNHATLVGDPTASLGSVPVLNGTSLRWQGVLQIGESVKITYAVLLAPSLPEGTIVENTVSGTAQPPGPTVPIEPPPVILEHPSPGFQILKTSDPAPRTNVQAGSLVTYAISGTNTGATHLIRSSSPMTSAECSPTRTWKDSPQAHEVKPPFSRIPRSSGPVLSPQGNPSESLTLSGSGTVYPAFFFAMC